MDEKIPERSRAPQAKRRQHRRGDPACSQTPDEAKFNPRGDIPPFAESLDPHHKIQRGVERRGRGHRNLFAGHRRELRLQILRTDEKRTVSV